MNNKVTVYDQSADQGHTYLTQALDDAEDDEEEGADVSTDWHKERHHYAAKHGPAPDKLAAIPLRQPASGYLGDEVAPEEGAQDQPPHLGIPHELALLPQT